MKVSLNSGPENWRQEEAPAQIPYYQGLPAKIMEDVIVLPFNDIESSRALLQRHGDRLAAIVIDPVPPRVGFLLMTHEKPRCSERWRMTLRVRLFSTK